MLSNSNISKPLLVIAVLVLAALACYSDSPLWPYELTEAPPSPTPLPTPSGDNPARFDSRDTVVAPRTESSTTFFLVLPDEPRPIDVADTKGCEYDTPLEIFYVGVKNEQDPQTGSMEDIIYYLVNCRGTVGWVTESDLEGPLKFVIGDTVLTTSEGATETTNSAGETVLQFPIETADPPIVSPIKAYCGVGEAASVIDFAVTQNTATPSEEAAVWYQIRCPGDIIGWVEEARLFEEELVFEPTGDIGVVLRDVELTDAAELPTDNNQLGVCERSSFIETLSLERVGSNIYYEIICGEVTGWTPQENLTSVPLEPTGTAIVFDPRITRITEGGNEASANLLSDPTSTEITDICRYGLLRLEDLDDGAEELPTNAEGIAMYEVTCQNKDTDLEDDAFIAISGWVSENDLDQLPLTENPGFDTEDNPQVGTCFSRTYASLLDVDTVVIEDDDGQQDVFIFYQVECQFSGEVGWISADFLLQDRFGDGQVVRFEEGDQVLITEENAVGQGEDRSFYISVGEIKELRSSRAGETEVEVCLIGTEAEVLNRDFLFERLGSLGINADVFYEIICENSEGEFVRGWVIQNRLSPVPTGAEEE